MSKRCSGFELVVFIILSLWLAIMVWLKDAFIPGSYYNNSVLPICIEEPLDYQDRVDAIVEEMIKRVENLVYYSFVMEKVTFKNGRYTSPELIYAEIRSMPKRVHLKWLDERHKGQQAWWPASEDDGRLIATGPGWRRFFKVKLHPLSKMAMKNSLHPIYDMGFDYITAMFSNQLGLVRDLGLELDVRNFSETDDKISLDISFPKDRYPEFYCYRISVDINRTVMLPIKIIIYDKVDDIIKVTENYRFDIVDIQEKG